MISAEIICDSINVANCRLTCYLVTYPRYLHSEVLRHRNFSFCCASSRARPVHKVLRSVWEDGVVPVFGENKAGMQSERELLPHQQWIAQKVWRFSSYAAICSAWILSKVTNAHKQHVNRILEPYSHMQHIMQGTDFGNFFNLRCSKEAQPEFRELAFRMLEKYSESRPVKLAPGEWHLPFSNQYSEGLSIEEKIKISTARCARVSYANFDGDFSKEKDFALYNKLVSSGHFSPAEFPCAALSTNERIANLCGWRQHRKTLKGENQSIFDVNKLLTTLS